MSVKREEALSVVSMWYEECVYKTITKGRAIEYEGKLINFINQQTTPTDIEGDLNNIKYIREALLERLEIDVTEFDDVLLELDELEQSLKKQVAKYITIEEVKQWRVKANT